MKSLNYLIDYILYQTFKITLTISLKNIRIRIRIYINKIENRITFRVKTEYCLELLTLETMKSLRSTKCKITMDKNGENVPHLEINQVVFVHCNNVNNDCQQDSRALYTFVPNKSFGQLLDISSQTLLIQIVHILKYGLRNSKLLEIEDKVNKTVVFNGSVKYKKFCAFRFNQETEHL